MKRLWLFAALVAFHGAAFGQAPSAGDKFIWIRTADGTAIRSGAICYGDPVVCYQDMRPTVRPANFGTSSGGTESGQYLVGRERCDTPFLSAAYSVERHSRACFKVEYSTVTAGNASGHVFGLDTAGTATAIGTWSSANTGLAHSVQATLENNTGAASHGTAFCLDVDGYTSIKIRSSVDIGVGEWVSIWVSAQ
jgi:hypothetical protein